jgi:hypothetical protein
MPVDPSVTARPVDRAGLAEALGRRAEVNRQSHDLSHGFDELVSRLTTPAGAAPPPSREANEAVLRHEAAGSMAVHAPALDVAAKAAEAARRYAAVAAVRSDR